LIIPNPLNHHIVFDLGIPLGLSDGKSMDNQKHDSHAGNKSQYAER